MEEKRKSGFATTSLVLGIVGVCISFIPIINNVAFILALMAIIFGIVSLLKKASKGMAIAGIIISVLTMVIVINSQKALSEGLETISNSLSDLTNEMENTFNVDNESIDKMTLEKFNKIQTGMTYKQVVEIIGSDGTLSTESSYGNQSMQIYYWYASNGISNATISFTNGKVSAKSQIGL